MRRNIIIFALFIFQLVISNSFALEIEKVTTSLQYLYNYYYDPGALKAKPDSSAINKDEDIMKSGKDSDSLQSEIIDARLEINDVALYFVDSVPYIHTVLRYDGDKSDLHTLGVSTGAYYGGVISVRFPLSILPQVATLSTVTAIRDNALVELQDNNDYIDIIPLLDSTNAKTKDTVKE